MYNDYFGFRENPFSIAPDPRYLFLSEMHQDGLAHLRFGAASRGGIILLTGEVGTGKTTLCRYFLEQVGPTAEVALIINPGLSASELLATVCDEFHIPVKDHFTNKDCIDALNRFLLEAHASNRETMLIIDEAQNLDKEALEMLRLLTNLETDQRKLLKIFLLGQSELDAMLRSPDLSQVSQRITGRFHLHGLEKIETADYIRHRLSVAGSPSDNLFSARAMRRIHRLTGGIPRLINALCDRSLLGAFSEDKTRVDEAIVKQAARELFGYDRIARTIQIPVAGLVTSVVVMVLILGIWAGTTSDLFYLNLDSILAPSTKPQQETAAAGTAADADTRTAEAAGDPDQTDGAAGQPAEPGPIATEPVATSLSDTSAGPPAGTQPRSESEESDRDAPRDDGIPSLFGPPAEPPPEAPPEQETTIVIKRIEIND